ncbi:MAG TPA: Do family serine endopeptidase [Thermoanaerobaculia bacterium]|nr:Do family serine endopeptidase [Thermoanaerobaculia bacterium]
MTQSAKKILSTVAIVIASVAFGVLISADLGLMPKSKAQQPVAQAPSAVPAVTIPSFADIAARVMPAVVSITSTEVVKPGDQRRQHPFGIDPFDFFFPDPRDPRRRRGDTEEERAQRSSGSGFIVSPDGFILTNNHVIEGATTVKVHFGADENGSGERTLTAKIVGRDPATDLALLKIDTQQALPTIPLGDSDRIRKGDWAIAVGNPYQFENTLTVGVISAKGRTLYLSETTRSFENFIQTDAAINFGNSGGPLLSINGEVIGINTAIRGGAQGLGFATPINTAKRLIPQLKQGKVTRSYLGMNIQEVTEETRQAFNLPDARGALVQAVTPGKPAEKAGIQAGDIIVEIDGRKVSSNRELIDHISYLPVGTSVRVTLIRNGERRTVTARTAERPLDGEPADDPEEAATAPARNRLGLSVAEISPAMRQMYGIEETVRGVVVTDVKEVSAAGEAGFIEGDVITEVHGQRVANLEQFATAVDRLRSGQTIRIYVVAPGRRSGNSGYRFLQVP